MRKISATVLGLLLIAGLVSACGSSDKSAESGTPSATTQPGNSGNGSGDGSNEFSDLIAKSSTANIRIVYERDGHGTVTFAQDGKGKKAVTDGDTSFYVDDDTTVWCRGTGSDEKCSKVPFGGLAGSLLTGFTSVFTGLTKLNASAFGGDVTSDTIAGRDAKCVTFTASNFSPLESLAGSLDGDATACADVETGFLLKLETSDGSSTKRVFVATEVGEATDADLTPPVEPSTISLPDIPGISLPQ
jgi:hypothetical protein